VIKSFLEYLTLEKNYSKHTVAAYKNDLYAFKDFCEVELDLENLLEVHYNHVRSFVVSLVNQKISNRSVNRKLSSLKTFYKFLQKTHQIELNPLAKHKALKVEKKVQVPFNQQEVEDVLELLNNQEVTFTSIRDKLIVELLYSTGIRRAELINLQEADVNLKQKTIKVLGKRNKERIIPLLPSVVNTMSIYKELKMKVSTTLDSFFVTEKGNKIYETLVYRIINSYFSQVSTKTKKSPHIVRHSFATHLLNEGANLNSVKELLGHASLASTQVYTHNSLDAIKKVYNQAHPKSRKNK
jgi:integrase/recombinase XerC